MFAIFVRLTVRPGQLEAFKVAIETDRTRSLADEPGCEAFEVHQIPGQELEFALYERYVDEDAFEHGHKGSPHYAIWAAAVPTVLVDGSLQVVQLGSVPWEGERASG